MCTLVLASILKCLLERRKVSPLLTSREKCPTMCTRAGQINSQLPRNQEWEWVVEGIRLGRGLKLPCFLRQTSLELGPTCNRNSWRFQNNSKHWTKGTHCWGKSVNALPINFTRPVNATWKFLNNYLLNQFTAYVLLYRKTPFQCFLISLRESLVLESFRCNCWKFRFLSTTLDPRIESLGLESILKTKFLRSNPVDLDGSY